MRHDRVQGAEIIISGINCGGTKQGRKGLSAYANVQSEYPGPVKIGEAIVIIIGGGKRSEWQHPVGSVEEELVAKILRGLDARKRLRDVLDD